MSRYLIPEVFLMFSLHFACADIHTHYFYTTVTNVPTVDLPSYTTRRTLDDISLYWYDSDDEVIQRRVPWFKSPYATLYVATDNEHSLQTSRQNFLQNILSHLRHTLGFHILQILHGCTLHDNDTIQTTFSLHYDGKPFMSFSVETLNWTADTRNAEIFVRNHNMDTPTLEENRYEMVNMCIPHITRLLSLGRCTFTRKVPPVVKVTQIPIDNVRIRLYCRAYGHYPNKIFIMWFKNGEQISEERMERMNLPIPGLTYLTSASFNVTSEDDGVYTCRVNHSSMRRDFTKDWRISGDSGNLSSAASTLSIGSVIAICLAANLVIFVIVFGAVSFAKRRRQQHPPSE